MSGIVANAREEAERIYDFWVVWGWQHVFLKSYSKSAYTGSLQIYKRFNYLNTLESVVMNSFKEREETRTSLDQKTQPLRESRLHPNFKKLASFGTQGMLGLTALYCGGEYFNEQNVTAGLIAGSILVYGIYRFTESMCPPVEEPSKHPFDDDDLLNF